jgi:signal transduction histidine kinase
MAEGMTYLAVAYLGMLIAIGIWTWTVFSRSNDLEQRIAAVERNSLTNTEKSLTIHSPTNDEKE